MNCSEAQDLLSAYFDKQLGAKLRDRLTRHVEACPRCSAELAVFSSLSRAAKQLPTPKAPAHIWENLQRELDEQPAVVAAPRPGPIRWRSFPFLAAAATLLIAAVGLSALFFASHRAQHNELAANFDLFLKSFAHDPDGAQQVLLTSYDGKAAPPEEVVKTLQYRPVALRGAPSGYATHAVYLLNMPCCRCAQVVYRRASGGFVTVFEHDVERPMWFGGRQCVCVQCNGTSCDVYQLDNNQLAVTCQLKNRPVTIVGARDVDEVRSLVSWLGQNIQDDSASS